MHFELQTCFALNVPRTALALRAIPQQGHTRAIIPRQLVHPLAV
jgi:hypothetical protein